MNEDILKQQLDEISGRLANDLLALAGGANNPPQPNEIFYNNLTEILLATLAKIEKQTAARDEYPYTWELFIENLEVNFRDWDQHVANLEKEQKAAAIREKVIKSFEAGQCRSCGSALRKVYRHKTDTLIGYECDRCGVFADLKGNESSVLD